MIKYRCCQYDVMRAVHDGIQLMDLDPYYNKLRE